MKKLTVVFAFAILVFCIVTGCKKAETKDAGKEVVPDSKYHIGIVTGTLFQLEDDLRGAEELIRRYGSVDDGGIIKHIMYPDDFISQQDITVERILSLAEDPLMKAVIVNQGVPGTAEAFMQIKKIRPDILCFVAEAHEDPLIIESAADMVVNADFISRGYTIVWAAKEMGAKNFIHISFPRHMEYATLGLRRQIMEEACNDLGLRFIYKTAPDPTGETGIAGAQEFILKNVPVWIQEYGADTAFFCTNDAHTEPLLKQLAEYGGIFVEADLPSPLMGYPGAFNIDVSETTDDFGIVLQKVEQAVTAKGGAGRFGTWAYSYGFTVSAGLGEYAKRILDGTAVAGSISDLCAALNEFTPGAQWNGSNYIDAETGIRAKNHALIYMDTYILGEGFLHTTDLKIPEKYYNMRFVR